ncbi:MAG: chondroitinase family polysaccharide lyase [Marinifilaceae bacterium]
MIKGIVALGVGFLLSLSVQGQYIGLEGKVPSNWNAGKGSRLSMSKQHYKLGKESLRWDFKANSELVVEEPEGMKTALTTFKGGLMLWVYNEFPVDDMVRFEFGREDQVEYLFEYGINFKGWRACWIRFDEDMKGPKKSKDLTWMKIIAPANVKKGSLFFDRMMFPKKRIHDRVTPDAQLPYINPKMNENHWAALYYWESHFQHDIELEKELSPAQKSALGKIEKKLLNAFKGKALNEKELGKLKAKYRSFGIKRSKSGIVGRPFVSKDEAIKKSEDITMDKVGKVLYGLARSYYHSKDAESKQMFLDLLEHMMDQGLAVGSGIGTNHHYGYQFRDYPPAIFLMKEVLKEKGKLAEVAHMINYWTGVQEYREKPEVGTLQGVMDNWNTTVVPRMLAILTLENPLEQVREMKALKRWMDISLKIVPGTMGGIKADGCGFHHGGLYPAYCNGGFSGIGEYLKYTMNTPWGLSKEARANFGLALQTMKNYTHESDWGYGICGRHPLSGTMSNGVKRAFAFLALAGNPYSGEPIWQEMAAAYLRLETGKSGLKKKFEKMGIEAEQKPEGHFTYNYGALGIHRRDNWMVSLKGYNKNVWDSEIYTKDNRYGRYQSYGTVQVMHGNGAESGFVQKGWDWNRYPGATSIHLPFDLLESPNKNTLMERSEEGFAGSSNLGGEYGIFGMKLMEKNRERFTPDFRARKSIFAFDDLIICLGSDISNSNKEYPTETTLFQSYLQNEAMPQYVNGEKAWNQFPVEESLSEDASHWLMDPYGNGYWIEKGVNVRLTRKEQASRHNKSKKPTKGKFAAAWIDHGQAPQKESYHYVVLPQSSPEKMSAFAAAMGKVELVPYHVLRQDRVAHIVQHKESKTTGYVVFEGTQKLVDDKLVSVSSSSLVMIQEQEEKLWRISVCDPDLHLPEQNYTTHQGSHPIKIQVELKGEWKLIQNSDYCKIINSSNGITQVEFTCVDGLPVEVSLKQ